MANCVGLINHIWAAILSFSMEPMGEVHRCILAPLLMHMLPAGDFLAFIAAGNFSSSRWCRAKIRELKAEVLKGTSRIQRYGLTLPPFANPEVPAAMAFDPMLLPCPLERFQRLWHIEGYPSCPCCVSKSRMLDPIQVLLYENRFYSSMLVLKESLDFLDRECRGLELASWTSIRAVALPWPLLRLYPRLPRRDFYTVDYAIVCFQYRTIGVAICFWRHSPAPWHLTIVPPSSPTSSSDDDDEDSMVSDGDAGPPVMQL